MARKRKGRALDGVFLLDKAAALSSNAALQQVKRLYGAAKAGHTGALDPLATGLLPICFGEATKLSHYLLDADKRYQTTAKLGIRTDSSDADGKVIATAEIGEQVTEAHIKELLVQHFTGDIEQVPSMFSALKFQGQPLYKLAREGKTVEVKKRQVHIFSIELTGFRDDEIDLDVHCSKGTYIRSIVEDLGLLLGCGAHVQKLHRSQVGHYKSSQMLSFEQLEQSLVEENQEDRNNPLDALLLPPWSVLIDAARIELDDTEVERIGYGQRIKLSQVESAPLVLMFAASDQTFLGLAEIDSELVLRPKRLVAN